MTSPSLFPNYDIGSASDVGLKRKGEPNQDCVGAVLPKGEDARPPLLVIADGMGGHGGGEVASRLVVETMQRNYREIPVGEINLAKLTACVLAAHRAVRTAAQQDSHLADMGSTVVAAVLAADYVYIVNVGDSRAYRLRGAEILQLSQDQSWVGDQTRAGLLSPEQARHHPARNRLTMSINARRPEITPHVMRADLRPNDVIVLCSDGLWGTIPDSIIWAAAMELQPQIAADKLVALANSSQGPDNISVIVARRRDFQPPAKTVNMEDTNPGIG